MRAIPYSSFLGSLTPDIDSIHASLRFLRYFHGETVVLLTKQLQCLSFERIVGYSLRPSYIASSM